MPRSHLILKDLLYHLCAGLAALQLIFLEEISTRRWDFGITLCAAMAQCSLPDKIPDFCMHQSCKELSKNSQTGKESITVSCEADKCFHGLDIEVRISSLTVLP